MKKSTWKALRRMSTSEARQFLDLLDAWEKTSPSKRKDFLAEVAKRTKVTRTAP